MLETIILYTCISAFNFYIYKSNFRNALIKLKKEGYTLNKKEFKHNVTEFKNIASMMSILPFFNVLLIILCIFMREDDRKNDYDAFKTKLERKHYIIKSGNYDDIDEFIYELDNDNWLLNKISGWIKSKLNKNKEKIESKIIDETISKQIDDVIINDEIALELEKDINKIDCYSEKKEQLKKYRTLIVANAPFLKVETDSKINDDLLGHQYIKK